MRIEALDLSVDTELTELHRLYRAHMEHDRTDQAVLSPEALRAAMTWAQPGTVVEHWGARDRDGRLVGYYDLMLPQRENHTNIHSIGWVHPERRRRGVATAMHRDLVERARRLGRDNVTVVAHEPVPGGAVEHSPGAVAFCERLGLDRVLVEIRRRLDLTATEPAALAELSTRAREKAADYETVTWRDRVDDSLAPDLARLEGRLRTDIPTGDLAWEPAAFDVDRWRAQEDMGAKRRRTLYYAAARHRPTGRLAAYTGLMLPLDPRTHALQQATVVAPDHRGRRLGTIVKLANLDHVRRSEPALRYIDTTNADENEHMIAINDAMGFVLCDATVSYQGPIRPGAAGSPP